jgi:hypothetical protein
MRGETDRLILRNTICYIQTQNFVFIIRSETRFKLREQIYKVRINYTSQHDFAVTQKIGYFNGNRCPESENDVSFFISRLVVVQFCFFGKK